MPKKPNITTVPQTVTNTGTINSNFTNLREAFNNTLSLDGSTPNAMQADLDLNGNDILNAGAVKIGGVDVIELINDAVESTAADRVQTGLDATAAATSADLAQISAAAAAASAAEATGLPDGGTTGQVLAKASDTNGDADWIDLNPLPAGGTTGQVLAKSSGDDGDVDWVDPSAASLPAGGATGQVLAKASSTDGDAEWVDPATGIVWQVESTTYTASAGDRIIADTTSSAWTLTLPATPSEGDVVSVANVSANLLTVAGGGADIEDASTFGVDVPNIVVNFVFDGTDWRALLGNGSVSYGSGSGSGDMAASTYDPQEIESDAFDRENHTGTQAIATVTGLQTALDGKQATLVSGTNVKTLNGESILGSGDLVVSGEGSVAAGDGIDVVSSTISVDETVVRTTGDQSITGIKTFERVQSSSDENNGDVPYLSIKPAATANPKNQFFMQHRTSDRNDATTVQIQRIVDTVNGYTNPKNMRVWTRIDADTADAEYAISAELYSYADVFSIGRSAFSATTFKYGLGNVFGGHFQVKDENKYSSASAVTAIIGFEMNMPCVGLDHPTSTSGTGNRILQELIARTNEGVSGWNTASGNYGDGETGTAIRIRADNLTDGYFRYGIAILDGTGNPNPIKNGIMIASSGQRGIHLKGANTEAQITSEGTPQNGIILNGTYGSGNAIRVIDGQAIALNSAGTVKMSFSSAGSVWSFSNSGTERVGLIMSGTGTGLRVNSVKVVGGRVNGWAAPTGTATRNTFATGSVTLVQLAERVKALIDDLTSHGLIGV